MMTEKIEWYYQIISYIYQHNFDQLNDHDLALAIIIRFGAILFDGSHQQWHELDKFKVT